MLDYGECSIAVVLEFKGPVGIIEWSIEIDSDTAPRAQSESMHEKAPPPWRYFRLREGQGFSFALGVGHFTPRRACAKPMPVVQIPYGRRRYNQWRGRKGNPRDTS